MKWRSLEESTSAPETRSLSEVFVERKKLIAQYVPPEIQAVHARAIAELQAQRVVERILPVGAKAPSFELRDHKSQPEHRSPPSHRKPPSNRSSCTISTSSASRS